MERDFRGAGIFERLCKVESGVGAWLCHRTPQKRRAKKSAWSVGGNGDLAGGGQGDGAEEAGIDQGVVFFP